MPDTSTNPHTIFFAGREVQYTVRRSARAKRIGLRVTPAHGLEVVLPAHGRLPDIPALLTEKAAWIAGALDRIQAQLPPIQTVLGEGTLLPYRGQEYRLIISVRGADKPGVILDETDQTLTAIRSPSTSRWYHSSNGGIAMKHAGSSTSACESSPRSSGLSTRA